ncbi:hypothetical protein B0T09DRAFT_362875 [Sordaria sp. MPI-SDFR-AT-0083]|nr:hypothetical protein B0T09DRAFT_362875 [Sordaria sp. MPI-SDFR-AT-0083]
MCGELSPHVESLLTLLDLEDIDNRLAPRFIRVFSYAGKYNIETGRFERARILLEAALRVAEQAYCPGHSATVLIVSDLQQLRMYYHKDHPFQNKIAGAATRLYTSLLGVLMNVANNIAALESYGLSVEKTFQNPANLTCEEEKALSLYDELKALGPEVFNDNASRIMHFTLNAPPCPFTSNMLFFLGIVTKHSSGSQNTLWLFIYEAMAGQGKDLEITDLLGPRPTTLNLEGVDIFNQVKGYNLLGALLAEQKRLEEGEEIYRKLLFDSLKELGSRHPNVLKVRGRIATILARRDKHIEAAVQFRHVLELRKETLSHLAKHDEAEELVRGSLQILQSRHENGHVPQTFFHAVITYGAILEHQGKTTQFNEFLMNHWKVTYVGDFEAWAGDRFDVADEGEETSSDEDEPYDEDGDSDIEESDIEGSESEVTGGIPAAEPPNARTGRIAISDLVHVDNMMGVARHDNGITEKRVL